MSQPTNGQAPTTKALADFPMTDTGGILIRSLDHLVKVAESVLKSGLAPYGIKTKEEVLVIMLSGMEVGLQPVQALQCLYVVKGRIGWMGEGLLAVLLSSGRMEWYKDGVEGEGDERHAWIESQRRGWPHTVRTTYSVADARRARLWGKKTRGGEPTEWVNNPENMLYWRVLARHVRRFYPDATKGLGVAEDLTHYPQPEGRADIVTDEVETIDGQPGTPRRPATNVHEEPPPKPVADPILDGLTGGPIEEAEVEEEEPSAEAKARALAGELGVTLGARLKTEEEDPAILIERGGAVLASRLTWTGTLDYLVNEESLRQPIKRSQEDPLDASNTPGDIGGTGFRPVTEERVDQAPTVAAEAERKSAEVGDILDDLGGGFVDWAGELDWTLQKMRDYRDAEREKGIDDPAILEGLARRAGVKVEGAEPESPASAEATTPPTTDPPAHKEEDRPGPGRLF